MWKIFFKRCRNCLTACLCLGVIAGEAWAQLPPPPVVEVKHTASDGEDFDWFGEAIAIDDEWMAVGAPREDGTGGLASGTGAVYMYRRDGVQWVQTDILRGDQNPFDNFGSSLAIDNTVNGPVLIVGAPGDDQAGSRAGAIYIFHYGAFCNNGTTDCWARLGESKLVGSNAIDTNDEFGVSVDLDNGLLVVGAWNDELTGTTDTGAAYVFLCNTYTPYIPSLPNENLYCSDWQEEWLLTPAITTGDPGDRFGEAVAIDLINPGLAGARTVAIGASGDDDIGSDSGAVYVYGRVLQFNGETFQVNWSLSQKITEGAGAGDLFGRSVDLSGNTLVAGAPFARIVGGTSGGGSQVLINEVNADDIGFDAATPPMPPTTSMARARTPRATTCSAMPRYRTSTLCSPITRCRTAPMP
jgi:hypothetical protein